MLMSVGLPGPPASDALLLVTGGHSTASQAPTMRWSFDSIMGAASYGSFMQSLSFDHQALEIQPAEATAIDV